VLAPDADVASVFPVLLEFEGRRRIRGMTEPVKLLTRHMEAHRAQPPLQGRITHLDSVAARHKRGSPLPDRPWGLYHAPMRWRPAAVEAWQRVVSLALFAALAATGSVPGSARAEAAPKGALRVADFLALHRGQGFVLPNAWDPGSARLLEQVGFPALATTSAGIAFALGRPDASLDRDTMLDNVARIVASVAVPVSADLEAGYGASPADVGRTIALAAELGVVGANLEDQVSGELFEVDEAAARIEAARAATPAGTFVINARTDTYFGAGTRGAFSETIERATRYVEAGADCIFVPGVDDADTIRRLAVEIPAPLNIVAGLTGTLLDAPTLFSLGVKRVSLGGSLARAALSLVERAGRELLGSGTLGFLEGAISYAELQRRFAS